MKKKIIAVIVLILTTIGTIIGVSTYKDFNNQKIESPRIYDNIDKDEIICLYGCPMSRKNKKLKKKGF